MMAIQIVPTSISGTGTFSNSVNLIIDNVVPGEGSVWTGGTNVYWSGITPTFTLSLGSAYVIQDLLFSVDNNDTYNVTYSLDNINWSTLITISSSYGEIGNGMDTMSTISGDPEYISQMDFISVSAAYIKIFATGGDNSYSIGELQIFGTTVPEPSTWLYSILFLTLAFKKFSWK